LRINVGRGFIENEQAIVSQDGSGQSYKLPLTDAEIMIIKEDMVQCDTHHSARLPATSLIALSHRTD